MENLEGYLKFRTPFYDIQISDSSGKETIILPDHIKRLVDKVEIMEALSTEQGPNTMTLTILEGSREPSNTLGDEYKVANYSISNKVGSIVDLVFDGNSGIDFRGNQTSDITTTTIGRTKATKVTKKQTRPRYLFQERNLVKVTWGYLESPETVRSISLKIMTIQTDFSDTGITKTTITCNDSSVALDQTALKTARSFGKRITTGKGNSILEIQDETATDLLKLVAKEAGIDILVTPGLSASQLSDSKQKVWIAGESFIEFLNRLAAAENAIVKIVYDETIKADKIYFIKRHIYERTFIPGYKKEYFSFKNSGSILKAVSIRADFGGIAGNTQKGLLNSGESIEQEDAVGTAESRLFSGNNPETALDADPNSNNPVVLSQKITSTIGNDQVSGIVSHNPSTNLDDLAQTSSINAYKQHNLVSLDFTALGYTKLTPGVINIDNIGLRYSGKYRILTATHTLDSQGYITKCSAISWSGPGGLKVQGANIGEEPKEEFVPSQLFSSIDTEVEDYHKTQGTV